MGDAALTPASWALGRAVARSRAGAGLTVQQVAKALKLSQPTVTRIEKGRHRLTQKQLTDLCRVLKIESDVADRLEKARTEAQKPDWRQDYAGVLDGPLGDVLGLEQGASRLRIYDPSFVPGLLQTEEYAAAVMREAPYVRETDVERRVTLRMRRQEGIWSAKQELVAVVNWSAVMQHVGGASVMKRQLQHLRKSIEQPNIMFRIVPRTAGAHAGYGSGCTIMDFPDGIDLPTVVWCETGVSSLIYEQPAKVETFVESFNMTWPSVLGRKETVEYLESIEADLE